MLRKKSLLLINVCFLFFAFLSWSMPQARLENVCTCEKCLGSMVVEIQEKISELENQEEQILQNPSSYTLKHCKLQELDLIHRDIKDLFAALDYFLKKMNNVQAQKDDELFAQEMADEHRRIQELAQEAAKIKQDSMPAVKHKNTKQRPSAKKSFSHRKKCARMPIISGYVVTHMMPCYSYQPALITEWIIPAGSREPRPINRPHGIFTESWPVFR